MNFSQRLTALLEERGWTQYRLAKNMDISQSTVSHWLNGEGTPQKHTLKRLAETLDVEVSYFTAPDILEMPERYPQKEKPAVSDELVKELEILQSRPEIRSLLHAAVDMTPEQVRGIGAMMESFRGGGNGKTD